MTSQGLEVRLVWVPPSENRARKLLRALRQED